MYMGWKASENHRINKCFNVPFLASGRYWWERWAFKLVLHLRRTELFDSWNAGWSQAVTTVRIHSKRRARHRGSRVYKLVTMKVIQGCLQHRQGVVSWGEQESWMVRSRKISFIIQSHHSLVKPLKTFVVGLSIGELEQQNAVKLMPSYRRPYWCDFIISLL